MKRLVCSTVFLAATLLCPPLADAQSGGNSRVTIDRALHSVELAAQATGAERDAHLRAALAFIEADERLAGSSALREPLAANPPQMERARGRLAAARAVLDPTPGPAPDADAARRVLAQILSNPPFRAWDPMALVPDWLLPLVLVALELAGWISRAVRWPFERAMDLLGHIMQSPIGRIGVLLLALGVLAGIVALYRFGLRSAIVAQAEVGPPTQQLPPTALRALELAQQHAAAGRYRDASHFVFLATLLWIEEHAEAHFDPTATNREHLVQVAGQPAIAVALAPVVAYFDRLWYGQESVEETDYRALLGLAARVREAAPQ